MSSTSQYNSAGHRRGPEDVLLGPAVLIALLLRGPLCLELLLLAVLLSPPCSHSRTHSCRYRYLVSVGSPEADGLLTTVARLDDGK